MPTLDQKVDFIFKKTLKKGDTLTGRDYFTERDSRATVFANEVWFEDIPTTRVSILDPLTSPHLTVEGNIQILKDVRLDKIPGSSFTYRHNADRDLLLDIVPNSYGDGSYNFILEDADGTKVDFGLGDWVFDLGTGQLRFYDPTNQYFHQLNSDYFTITCFKYTGQKLSNISIISGGAGGGTGGAGGGTGGAGGGTGGCGTEWDEEGENVHLFATTVQSNSNLFPTVGVFNTNDDDTETLWSSSLPLNVWVKSSFVGVPRKVTRMVLHANQVNVKDFAVFATNNPLAAINFPNFSDWDRLYTGTFDLGELESGYQGFIFNEGGKEYEYYLAVFYNNRNDNLPISAFEIQYYETVGKARHACVVGDDGRKSVLRRVALFEEEFSPFKFDTEERVLSLESKLSLYGATISLHVNDFSNPHQVTKNQLGLSLIQNIPYVAQISVGVPFGVAPLDSNNLVPLHHLPAFTGGLSFKGTWNALTNVGPKLVDGGETDPESNLPAGSFYIVSTGSTSRVLDGVEGFAAGDWVIKNDEGVWAKIANAGTVFRVNGQTGFVSLETDDIPEGTINLYYQDSKVQAYLDAQGITAKLHTQNTDSRLRINPVDLVPTNPLDPIVPVPGTGLDPFNYITANQIIWHILNNEIHLKIKDNLTNSSDVWSSQKIENRINEVLSVNFHSHSNKIELDKITDGDHERKTDNPHEVTKEQLGLSLIENVPYVKIADVGKYGEVFRGVPPLTANNKIPFSYLPIQGGLRFKGLWEPTTNTPFLASGGMGDPGAFYVVKQDGASPDPIDGISNFIQGDWLVDADGKWEVIDGAGLVIEVNGKNGVVSLFTNDVPEDGTIPYGERNLYFTEDRVLSIPAIQELLFFKHEQNTDWYLDQYNDHNVKTSGDSIRAHLENRMFPVNDDGDPVSGRNNTLDPRLNATNPHDTQFDNLVDTKRYYGVSDTTLNAVVMALDAAGKNPVTTSSNWQTFSFGPSQFMTHLGINAFNGRYYQPPAGNDRSFQWVVNIEGPRPTNNPFDYAEDHWIQVDFGGLVEDDELLDHQNYYIPNNSIDLQSPSGDDYYEDMRGYVRNLQNGFILQDNSTLKQFNNLNLAGFFDPRFDEELPVFQVSLEDNGKVIVVTRDWSRTNPLSLFSSPVEGQTEFQVGQVFIWHVSIVDEVLEGNWVFFNDSEVVKQNMEAAAPDSAKKGFLFYRQNYNWELDVNDQVVELPEGSEIVPKYKQQRSKLLYPGKVVNGIGIYSQSGVKDFSFYGSFDGEKWFRLCSGTHDNYFFQFGPVLPPPPPGESNPSPEQAARSFFFHNDRAFRFYRLKVHNTWDMTYVNIIELFLYENSLKGQVPIINNEQLGLEYTPLTSAEAVWDHLLDNENPHNITPEKIGAATKEEFLVLQDKAVSIIGDYTYHRDDKWNPHLVDYDNPHKVDKVDVGLSEVHNVRQIPYSYIGIPGGVAPLSSPGSLNEGRVPYENLPLAIDLRGNIVDNLESVRTDLALSANQGRHLRSLLDVYADERTRVVVSLSDMVNDAFSTKPNFGTKYLVATDSENDGAASLFVVNQEIGAAFNGSPTQESISDFWTRFGFDVGYGDWVWTYNSGEMFNDISYIHQIYSKYHSDTLAGYSTPISGDFNLSARLTSTREEGGSIGLFYGDGSLVGSNIATRVRSHPDYSFSFTDFVSLPGVSSPFKLYREDTEAIELVKLIANANTTGPIVAPAIGQKYFLQSIAGGLHPTWTDILYENPIGSGNYFAKDLNEEFINLTNNSYIQYTVFGWRVVYNQNGLISATIQNGGILSFMDNTTSQVYTWNDTLSILEAWTKPIGGDLVAPAHNQRYILGDVSTLADSWGLITEDISGNPATLTNGSVVEYRNGSWKIYRLTASYQLGDLIRKESDDSYYSWDGSQYSTFSVADDEEVAEVVLDLGLPSEEVLFTAVLRDTDTGWDSVFYNMEISRVGNIVKMRISDSNSLVFNELNTFSVDLTSAPKFSGLLSPMSSRIGLFNQRVIGAQVVDIKISKVSEVWDEITSLYFTPVKLRTNLLVDDNYLISLQTVALNLKGANDLYNFFQSNKASKVSLVDHILDFDNPHHVTKESIGLGNVLNVEQIPVSAINQPNGVLGLDSSGKISIARLYTEGPNQVALLDGAAKISMADLHTNTPFGLAALDYAGKLDISYFKIDEPGGFTSVQPNGYIKTSLINAIELPFPLLTFPEEKINSDYLYTDQPGGVPLLDVLGKISTDVIKTDVPFGIPKLDANAKISLPLLYASSPVGTPNGLATLDNDGIVHREQLPPDTLAGLKFAGFWEAGLNNPTFTDTPPEALDTGVFFVVSETGNTTLGDYNDWRLGDWLLLLGTPLGAPKEDQTRYWFKLDNNNGVQSINGNQGIVSLDTDDIPEGSSNLYYTNQRVFDYLSVIGVLDDFHTQGTDQHLDFGGAHQVGAVSLAAHIKAVVSISTSLQIAESVSTLSIVEQPASSGNYKYRYAKPAGVNIHNISPYFIGAPTIGDLAAHALDFDNPHATHFRDLEDVVFKGGDYDLTTGLVSIVTSSSNFPDQLSPAGHAVNDNESDFWYASSDDREWLNFHFGLDNPHKVISYKLLTGEYGVNTITILGSNDPLSLSDNTENSITAGVPDFDLWDVIHTHSGAVNNFSDVENPLEVSFSNDTYYSYYRVYFHTTAIPSTGVIGVREIELYTTAEDIQGLGFRWDATFTKIIAGKRLAGSSGSSSAQFPNLGHHQTLLGLPDGSASVTVACDIVKYESKTTNSAQVSFPLNKKAVANTVEVFVNGLMQLPEFDYFLVKSPVTYSSELMVDGISLVVPPLSIAKMWVNYWSPNDPDA